MQIISKTVDGVSQKPIRNKKNCEVWNVKQFCVILQRNWGIMRPSKV